MPTLPLALAALSCLALPCSAQTILYEIPATDRAAIIGDVDKDGVPEIGSWQGLTFSVISGASGVLLYNLSSNCTQVIGMDDIDGDGSADYGQGDCSSSPRLTVRSGRDGDFIYGIGGGSIDTARSIPDLTGDGIRDVVLLRRNGGIDAWSGADGAGIWTQQLVCCSTIIGGMELCDDANFDGVADLLVRAEQDPQNPAHIFTISSVDGVVIRNFVSPFTASTISSMAALHDIDDDAIPDVLVTCASCPSSSGKGRAVLCSGFDGSILRELTGTEGDLLGVSSATAADLDGDGRDEYIIGASGEDSSFADVGAVHVFDRDNGNEVLFIPAPTQSPGFGAHVLAADLTGDGLSEVIAINDSGHTWAIAGPCPSSEPENYCIAAPNSAGPGSVISGLGSRAISDNSFLLVAQGAPPGQPGLFFYGGGQVQYLLGNGFLCVAGGGVGVFRLSPQVVMDSGYATRHLDFTQPPAGFGAGKVKPGSSWNFQFWYRDPMAGGAGFNLSDGLTATFCP